MNNWWCGGGKKSSTQFDAGGKSMGCLPSYLLMYLGTFVNPSTVHNLLSFTKIYKKRLQKNKILNNAKETKNPSIMYNMKHCIEVVGTGGMDMLWNGIGIGSGNFIQS